VEEWQMPLAEGVFASLIANALSEVVRCVMADPDVRPSDSLRAALLGDAELEDSLRKAMVAVAKDIQMADSKARERLQLFLISPSAEAIVRQMYGFLVVPNDRVATASQLEKEFTLLLAVHLDLRVPDVSELGSSLFTELLKATERAVKLAISKGILSAHEASSERRFRVLFDELLTIDKNIELLRGADKPNVEQISAFEQRYRNQVAERHGHITPPTLTRPAKSR
jgi:hypothetical protein